MADAEQLTTEPHAAQPRGERPWLRLVRAAPESLGPVSPELVLVFPTLAAAVRPTPDALVVGDRTEQSAWNASTADVAETPRRRSDRSDGEGPRESLRYDTRDLLLERHGLTLELEGRDAKRSWRLTTARGDIVEAPAEGPGVPERIESLLRTLMNGGELRRVPVRSADPEVRRLEEQIGAQHDSLLRHDVGARIASDPENLHQLRVAARRTRAFLRVARQLVNPEWAAGINTGLRDLGRATGDARDLDILLDHLREQVRSLDFRDLDAAAELISALEHDRRNLQQELLALLDSRPYRRLLDELALPVDAASTPASRSLEQLAGRELRRLVAQVRKLGKRPADERLHGLRIKVKRVRYAAELGGLPTGAKTARVVDAATRLQDILGEHQDAVVGEERIRTLAHRIGRTDVAFVAGRLAERQRQRRDELQFRLPPAWKQLRRLARKMR